MVTPWTTAALVLCLLLSSTSPSTSSFHCRSPGTCTAIIDYTTRNTTTLSSIQKLFSLKNLNLLPLNTTTTNSPLSVNSTVKIPFPCLCRNGTGTSNNLPTYTVKPGDYLTLIAGEVFAGLVTVDDLRRVNNISDPNLIQPGDVFYIPLPCSCDEVDGERVVHYGRRVNAGETIEAIAKRYNVSQNTLLQLNDLQSAKDLQAGSLLDVPLKTCQSMVRNTSLDYPLLVPNDTYVLTASNCVTCKCDAANNWTLQCQPSQIKSSLWKSCPSMQCQGFNNMYIGNTTSSDCKDSTACVYAGYSNQTIFTTTTRVTCPVSSSGISEMRSGTWKWSIILVTLHLVLLSAHHLPNIITPWL